MEHFVGKQTPQIRNTLLPSAAPVTICRNKRQPLRLPLAATSPYTGAAMVVERGAGYYLQK